MAIEDIKSDLQSLIKLYRHLQSLKVGSQSAGSEHLDEKAQTFLKDLLDGASEKVFEAHSEFMAARLDVSEAAPKTLEFSSENSNPKPAKRRRHYRIHPKIRIEQFKSRDTKRVTREKDLTFNHQQSNKSSPLQWSEIHQQKLIFDDPSNSNSVQINDDSATISGMEVAKSKIESSTVREIERKNEVADSMCNEVASTIKIIDSHLSALDLVVDPVITEQCAVIKSGIDMQSKPVNESVLDFKDINRVPLYDYMNDNIGGNEDTDNQKMKPMEAKLLGNVSKLNENVGKELPIPLTNNLEEDKLENPKLKEPFKLGLKKEDQVAGESVKAIVQRIESMSRLSSINDQTPSHSCRYIRGMRVPVTPSLSQIENEFQDLHLRPQSKLNKRQSCSSMSSKIHNRYMVSPILYGSGVDKREVKAQGNKQSMANRNKMILEDTSSSSVASSNWTRQKGSISSSNIDEYSQANSQSDDYAGSTSYPDSENSRISSGDSDLVLSESTEHQSLGLNEDSESISAGSMMNRRSNSIKLKKQTGGFKKLKDKIGLIFHHHHHHHHHHDNGAPRGKSLWKNAGKILRGKGKTAKHKGKAVEKDTSSLVNKKHNGHFHDIVKGVWKHVKTTKSSKVSKGDKKRNQGEKKGAQKMQWWKMLQQQRAVKKTPKKPKIKVEVGTKKHRLRALPMLTSEDGEA